MTAILARPFNRNDSNFGQTIQSNRFVAYWHHMATKGWVNTGTGNGVLPDHNRQLAEPTMAYHRWGPVAITWGNFQMIYLLDLVVVNNWQSPYLSNQSLQLALKLLAENCIKISQEPISQYNVITLVEQEIAALAANKFMVFLNIN